MSSAPQNRAQDSTASTGTGAAGPDEPLLSPAVQIFLASVVGLLLELALIRWISSEVRIFAYVKNLVLIASFLGFGLGLFLHGRPALRVRSALVLVLLLAVIHLPWPTLQMYGPSSISTVLATLPGFLMFHLADAAPLDLSWAAMARLTMALGWCAAIAGAVVYCMAPFGQLVGAAITRHPRPLQAYSINVAGSLTGILLFSLVSAAYAPPVAWFGLVLVLMVPLEQPARRGELYLATGLVLALLLPVHTDDFEEVWSAYQKLVLHEKTTIAVNNIGYQVMKEQPELGPDLVADRFTAPYLVKPEVDSVLIVGAGSGNDVAVALKAGARTVTAVEIDRAIQVLGSRYHPQEPYADPRVRVVIDDARHFLKTTAERFDVIVFSHLDSHAVLSSHTSVRLDDYIYTVEAFREARARLAPGGLVFVSFWAQQPFIGPRLEANLAAAFGHPPLALQESLRQVTFHPVAFFTGEAGGMQSLRDRSARLRPAFEDARFVSAAIAPSTDSWPFLGLERRGIPPVIVLVSGTVLLLAVALVFGLRPRGTAFDGRVFWLGAAFMLLEVHNVSRLALVFGTTWVVNAWVIGAILTVVLGANAVCSFLARRGRSARTWPAIGLFTTLGLGLLVPIDVVATGPVALGGLTVVVLLTLPIFFAGVVFANAFVQSPAPGFALGWNALGSVVGGLTESFSYVLGIPALLFLAAAFYAAALAWRSPRSPSAS